MVLPFMRFLMLNWRDPETPKAGGAERVSQAYLAGLVRQGHEVTWFANDFEGAARESEVDGIKIVRGGGYGSSVLAARKWYGKQPKFDLVIDQHHGIPWYAPWWCGTNCIAYIHEVLGPIWNEFYGWPASALGTFQERWTHWLYRNVHFWTPSESTRKALQENGVKHVKVIPNGTETVALAALNEKPFSEPFRFATVSRLAPNKRIDHAIEMMAVLKDRRIDARLEIVGTGEQEAELRSLVKERQLEPLITFTGKLNEAEKNEKLKNSHFLIHPSVREGWGLNVIEANAMGTPAIVYPVGGLVDSTVDGLTGIVTRTETPASLADAVQNVSMSARLYEKLRFGAWDRSKQFHWDAVLPQACDWLERKARGERA
jgi:glycosyltransferase involved in cell wall biosynthesis